MLYLVMPSFRRVWCRLFVEVVMSVDAGGVLSNYWVVGDDIRMRPNMHQNSLSQY